MKKQLFATSIGVILLLFPGLNIAQQTIQENSLYVYSNESQEEALRLNNLGAAENSKYNYEKALYYLDRAVNLWNKAMIYNNRACSYLGLQKYDEALRDAKMAVLLDPSDYKNWQDRGEAQKGLKKYEEAIADFTKAISLNPNAWAYFGRAESYMELKNFQAAYDDFSLALQMEPLMNEAGFFNDFGYVANNINKYNESVQYLEKAIKLNPNNPNSYFNLGDAYRAIKKYEESIINFTKGISLNPVAWAYKERGESYIDLENYPAAYQDFAQVTKTDPGYNDPDYFNSFGYLTKKMERYSESIIYFNKAIQLKPTFPNPHYYLGEVYFKIKQYNDAYNHYQECLKYDPSYDMSGSSFQEVKNILGK